MKNDDNDVPSEELVTTRRYDVPMQPRNLSPAWETGGDERDDAVEVLANDIGRPLEQKGRFSFMNLAAGRISKTLVPKDKQTVSVRQSQMLGDLGFDSVGWIGTVCPSD